MWNTAWFPQRDSGQKLGDGSARACVCVCVFVRVCMYVCMCVCVCVCVCSFVRTRCLLLSFNIKSTCISVEDVPMTRTACCDLAHAHTGWTPYWRVPS